jgi:uncharacterized protein
MKFIALAFSCLLFFSIPAPADDVGLFNAMLALANKGDAEAQYHVGMMHNNGIGTQQDPKQAFQWFQKSTASHDPLGAYKLGCYYAGQFAGVVEADPNEALKYKLISAKAGYSLAQHDVALLYAQQGNMEEAVKWMQMAADQGDDPALYKMSRVYRDGKGVPKDLSLAFAYFKLGLIMSQSELNADAKAVLDEMIAKMSDAELQKAQKMVADWKPQPTALTIKAKSGLAAAEELVQKAK